MRQELLESYRREDAAQRLVREAIDMSVEEPDHAHWYLGTGPLQPGDPTVGGGRLGKDLVESSAADIRKQAFLLFYASPFVRGITRTLRKFIFGKGVEIELSEQNQSKKKQADEYLDEWKDTNRWDLVQKESSDRTFRDGEAFWHNRWMGSKKVPRLEFIEPDDVRSDLKNASHGIEMEPRDPTTVKRYHVKQLTSDVNDRTSMFIAGEDMVHMKINVDSNMKRGRSLFEPVFRHLKWHDDWLQSRIVLNKVRSAVALVRHVEGTQAQGQMIRKQTETANLPTDRRRRATSTMFRSGSVFSAGPGVKYEMLSANLQASDAAQDGRNILLSIAVGVGFPEMFLTADFSNANYASTAVAQNPFVREFEDWQDFFDFHIRAEIKRVLELGIKARLVAKDTDLKCTCKFQPLTYEDFVQMSTALGQLYLNEIISGHTYAQKLGFDFDEEKKLRDEETAEYGDNQLGADQQDGQGAGDQGGGGGTQQADFLQDDRESLVYNNRDLSDSTIHEVRARWAGLNPQSIQRRQERIRLAKLAKQGRLSPGGLRKLAGLKKAGGGKNLRQARALELGNAPAADGLTKAQVQVGAYHRTDPRTGKEINVPAYSRLQSTRVKNLEKFYASGTLKDLKFLGGGVEETYHGYVYGENGQKEHVAFKKENRSGQTANEVAASAVAQTLGLGDYVGATIRKEGVHTPGGGGFLPDDNAKGPVLEFYEDYKQASSFGEARFTQSLDPITASRLALYDYIIGNHDRHRNNWMMNKHGGVKLVDHERAFTDWGNVLDSEFSRVQGVAETKIEAALKGTNWTNLLPTVKQAMRKSGLSLEQVNSVVARYNQVLEASRLGKLVTDMTGAGRDRAGVHPDILMMRMLGLGGARRRRRNPFGRRRRRRF